MSHDPSQQPQPAAPPPPAPQGAYPPPPAPQGAYPPAPGYAQQPAYGQQPGYPPVPYAYAAPLPKGLEGRELADWGVRCGARLLDTLFVILTLFIGAIVNWFLMAREGERNGMSLGKQVCNLRVVKEDGTPMTAGDAIVRQFVVKTLLFYVVGGFFFFPWVADFLWPLGDDRNQALHDKMVSTYVVRA